MRSLFTIYHIHLQLHRQAGLQLKRGFCYLLCFTEIRSVFVWIWICYQNRSQTSQVCHGFPSTEQKGSTLDHKDPWLQLQDWIHRGYEEFLCYILSHLPYRPSDSSDDNELSGLDMTDKTFEVGVINRRVLILRLA